MELTDKKAFSLFQHKVQFCATTYCNMENPREQAVNKQGMYMFTNIVSYVYWSITATFNR
jgi:hypothetical protein